MKLTIRIASAFPVAVLGLIVAITKTLDRPIVYRPRSL